jgi:hypothetical protein
MGLSYLIFIGSMWALVPAFSLLLGYRPPWHELWVISLGWVGGFPLTLLIAWCIRRIVARR